MEVVRRVKTPKDAEVAMEVARQYALQRAHRQQHDGLSPNMSYIILKVHSCEAVQRPPAPPLTPLLAQSLKTAWQHEAPPLPTSPQLQTGYPRRTLH